MISKKQLLAISKLELSGIIDTMDADGFSRYCNALNKFIAGFPDQAIKLKTSFDAKDVVFFSASLLTVSDTLIKIHAKNLAQKSFKLLDEVKAEKYETSEANLTELLAEISALSIDIQVAQMKRV